TPTRTRPGPQLHPGPCSATRTSAKGPETRWTSASRSLAARSSPWRATPSGTRSAGPASTAPTRLAIRYNTFDTNRPGITVGIQSDDASSVTIAENNIVHNADAFGIFSPRTATFPATDNFWGSPGGPFNAVNNPTGDPSNQVSSPVTPLTPFAPAPFPLNFAPAPFAIPFALPRRASTRSWPRSGGPSGKPVRERRRAASR